MSPQPISPYVTRPPIAKFLDVCGRVFTYLALIIIGVTALVPGTTINQELQPQVVFSVLLVVLAVASSVALVGVLVSSYFTEAFAIGLVFLGFTPVLIMALQDLTFDLESVTALILSATIVIRWNFLNSAISQARELKELTDAGIPEVA